MEKKDYHIVPECYIDTNITEFLLDSHGVNHQKGCNAVAKKMMESNLKDQFSVGIIDNDKRQHSYVTEFTEIAHTQHITLLKHKERSHYFIRISPAMDQFILYNRGTVLLLSRHFDNKRTVPLLALSRTRGLGEINDLSL